MCVAALERAYEDPHLTLQERYDKLLGLLKEEARQRAEAERSSLGLREQVKGRRAQPARGRRAG